MSFCCYLFQVGGGHTRALVDTLEQLEGVKKVRVSSGDELYVDYDSTVLGPRDVLSAAQVHVHVRTCSYWYDVYMYACIVLLLSQCV